MFFFKFFSHLGSHTTIPFPSKTLMDPLPSASQAVKQIKRMRWNLEMAHQSDHVLLDRSSQMAATLLIKQLENVAIQCDYMQKREVVSALPVSTLEL